VILYTNCRKIDLSRVEITKIFINNFKRIQRLELDVQPITALVGGNTSGKSSVLQAAQLCVSLLQSAYRGINRRGEPQFVGSVSDDDVVFHPTHKILDLKHGGSATERKGFEIGFECLLTENEITETGKFILEVKRGKNANISLRIDGDTRFAGLIAGDGASSSIFTPGLSGISIREELRTRGALAAGAMQGDANTYIRSLLYHLFEDYEGYTDEVSLEWSETDFNIDPIDDLPDSKWKSFCMLLAEVYDGARLVVYHDQNKEQFLDIKINYDGQKIPLDLASTGMLQVVQILAYACYFNPALLLLDEPDSHLHADSQSKLLDALTGLTNRTRTRIVLASHSPQLIQEMNGQNDVKVCWMEDGAEVELNENKLPAIPLLMRLGALGIGSDVFDPQKNIILLTEDKKTDLVRIYAAANGAGKNVSIISYSGCDNLSGARRLGILLRDLRPDITVIIHRDRDYRTENELKFEEKQFSKWCQLNNVSGVIEIFTSMNDIEHMFSKPEHIKEVIPELSEEEIEKCIQLSIAENRDEFVTALDKARNVLQQRLYDTPRIRQKAEWRDAGLPLNGKGPEGRSFRPALSTDPFPFEVCHGKKLEKAVRQKIAASIGGDFDEVLKKLHSQSKALSDPNWQGRF
jgi:predicted ATPase